MAKKNTDSTKKKKKAKQKSRRHGEQFQEWRTVANGTAANAADLPGTEVQRVALTGVIDEVDKLLAEQAVLQASKQVVSQRLKILINQGGKLSTVLRAIVKQRYGHGNDKLVEFGIKPLRSRPRPTVVPPTEPLPEAGTLDLPATTTPLSSE
ncbi:MAG: hypothetical protein WAM82_19920 [Thermoanaerobaculia bacterium]